MTQRSVAFTAAAILAAALPAQTKQVSPSALTNAYGGINNSIPWGPFVPSGNTIGEIMVLQIDEELQGQTALLQAMAFRHQYTATHVPKAYTAQLTLADAATGAAGISSTFATNYKVGGNQAVVVNGVINFPANNPYPRPPSPFDAPVMFTTPYLNTGSDPLLWELIIFGTSPVTPTHFFERGPGGTHTAGWIGNGCTVTGGVNPLTATGSISGTAMTNTLANGPASSPAALMIGDTSPTFSGLPLPVNLGFLGSPNCDLNINAVFFLATGTGATGSASSSIPYTMNPGLSGQRLRTQWVAVDVGTLTIYTSNGLDHGVPYNATTGRPWPQARVYANGWGATPPLMGTIQVNGLVTEWTY